MFPVIIHRRGGRPAGRPYGRCRFGRESSSAAAKTARPSFRPPWHLHSFHRGAPSCCRSVGAVACGGIVVHSGDIVVGDEDGVVVAPLADAPAVAERLKAIAEKEKRMEADLAAGRLVPEWVDATLTAKGCEIIR